MNFSDVIRLRRQEFSAAAKTFTENLAFRIIVTALFVVVAFWFTGLLGRMPPCHHHPPNLPKDPPRTAHFKNPPR